MRSNFEQAGIIALNIAVTFVQGALVVWAASDFSNDRLVLGAAVGAGSSAVWNLVLKPAAKNYGFLAK